ncbi:hypothetical protein BCR32DRAFT_291251 [Anaeromyces robustus]|uniref:CBM1 domain-containing protein n=1 Tax=Anaeromyces robustus TaxID=1754192 RepID=A0A1Y1XFM6_9FUNG|nr:hypothetical protein BCR32DRAFT_291251 [Anaeromyces robustus]|eukprot:ORX84523.1 hypothetical protein BCR32DRAFT_291251 [Anaeromyces robustus]
MKFVNLGLYSLFFVYALAATTKTVPVTTKTVPSTSYTKSIPNTSSTKTVPYTSSTKTVPYTSSKTVPNTSSSTKSVPKTSSTKSISYTSSKTVPATSKTNNSAATGSNSSSDYLSCGTQDWDCKSQKSNECYAAVGQCWAQPYSSSVAEECAALDKICQQIWN